MRIAEFIALAASIVLASCSHKDSEPDSYEFLTAQRQKVANALSKGVNTDAAKPLVDSLKAGVDTLWVDFSIDKPGNVRFVGYVALGELLDRAEKLDGSVGLDAYKTTLAYVAECVRVGMYYDGNLSVDVAQIGLQPKLLRDSFGDFYAYLPSLRFRPGASISLTGFFNSPEFAPYRGELSSLLEFLGDD